MDALQERVQASYASSVAQYEKRIASGQQPAPPEFVTSQPWLSFLDYRNNTAILAANAAYLVIIGLLYAWMSRRPQAFELRWLMIAYNAVCVALAAYVVVGVVKYKVTHPPAFVCNKPDFTPAGTELSLVIWAYYAQKFLEFGDTVFFVLRKSFRQLTGLHLYHHVSITLVTAAFVRFDVNGDDYLAALLNSFVHVLMYSHYLLAAFKINTRWKKQLTSLQLVQFTIVLGQTLYAFFIGGPKCGSPDWLKARQRIAPMRRLLQADNLLVLMITYQVTMLVLFGLFYLASYKTAKREKGARAQASAKKKA